MTIHANWRRVIAVMTVPCATFVVAGGAAAQKLPWSLPACESERAAGGWTVTSRLTLDASGDFLISYWEARRTYSENFGLRIVYDTSYDPTPHLQIWHNRTRGDFKMRLPDETELSATLNASYTITQARLRPQDAEALRAQPVHVEYAPYGGRWQVYRTEGLPEAVAVGEADLALAKERHERKECSAGEGWWRRFTNPR